ncbi:MAG: phage holin family protein [Candidatus Paceibacterota bacterium]|jgi:putative membrane protein
MKIVLHWLLLSLAIFILPFIIHGIGINPFYIIFVIGACLMFIDLIIKPIIKILTLPINILTLGLFSLVLNGLIFYFLAYVIPGFTINGFASAFFGALLISIFNWILKRIVG